jgi:hypothetical protein
MICHRALLLRAPGPVLIALSLLAVCACSKPADPNVIRVDPEVVPRNYSSAPAATAGKPEPIYSTTLVIQLAELALKDRGVNIADRSVAVSFIDGVYTVTFAAPSDDATAVDYKVEVSAGTSKILKVQTTR